MSSLKYLHPKDVTAHTRFSVIHYFLYENCSLYVTAWKQAVKI